MSNTEKGPKPPSNSNPLIHDNPIDTLDAMHVRAVDRAEWAEGDDDRRAILQDMRMMAEALRWVQLQVGDSKK